MVAKFEISKDSAGKFRFHLKAPNGEIIAASQGYETKASAEKGMRRSRLTRLAQRSKTTAEPVRIELMADVHRKDAHLDWQVPALTDDDGYVVGGHHQ